MERVTFLRLGLTGLGTLTYRLFARSVRYMSLQMHKAFSFLRIFWRLLPDIGYGLLIFVGIVVVQLMLIVRMTDTVEKCQEYLLRTWPSQKCEILFEFGWVYESQNDIERAVRCFEELAKLEPKDAVNRFFLGKLFEKSGNNAEAVRYYEETLELGRDLGAEFKSQVQSKIDTLGEPE